MAAVTVLILLMFLLFSRPGNFDTDPSLGYLCCAAFAALATGSHLAAAKAAQRPVPLIEAVSALALWALLPLIVFLSVWLVLAAGGFAIFPVFFLALPVLLAEAARRVARRGRVALGTGLLLVGLLYTVGVVGLWAVALPLRLWLPLVVWHLALAPGRRLRAAPRRAPRPRLADPRRRRPAHKNAP